MDTTSIIVVVGIVIMSITTHEVAHAWAAYRLGDDTAQRMGRLTLNPLVHVDPFMTVILPGLLLLSGSPVVFGGAKPVPFNPFMLKKVKRDVALVAAAGPISNILIGFMLFGLLSIFLHTGLWNTESKGVDILAQAGFINIFLAVFNLIPIPPLDGSKVLQYFLSGELRIKYLRLEAMGFMIILGLLILDRGILHLGLFEGLYSHTVVPISNGMMELLGIGNFFRL
jgi:Zn-dependent protease